MHDPRDQLRFTVGRLEIEPNSAHTVPARVTFTIDVRHPDAAVLDARSARLVPTCERPPPPCRVRVERTFERAPRAFPKRTVDIVAKAARALGIGHMRLASGAFHDAGFVADLAPTGMIFVPCRDGISHNEIEDARKEDVAAGCQILLQAMVERANS